MARARERRPAPHIPALSKEMWRSPCGFANRLHFYFQKSKFLTNYLYSLSRRYGRAWDEHVTRKNCLFAAEGSVCWKPLLTISECPYGETAETECPDFSEKGTEAVLW